MIITRTALGEEKDGYKKLMIAVLAQMITDYIQAIKVGNVDFIKKLRRDRAKMDKMEKKSQDRKLVRNVEIMTRGQTAKHFIFDNSKSSENYVFGFKFMCSWLGLDPERFREKIKKKRIAFWKNIFTKIREDN